MIVLLLFLDKRTNQYRLRACFHLKMLKFKCVKELKDLKIWHKIGPDSMTFGPLEDGSIGCKRTRTSEIQRNNDESMYNQEEGHVSIDLSPALSELVSSRVLDHQEIDEDDLENTLLESEIMTRPKKKAKKRSKIITALKVVGAALGLGTIGLTSTSKSLSQMAIAGNASTALANTTGSVWFNNVHSEANPDRLNVIEQKVNESFYKYGFAW